jgi:Na+-transporting methylmalonyl-CoA/oxaloacetate decarboxylase beta subunit
LNGVEQWAMFLKPLDPFLTIRANILIRGLLNKARIEKLYQNKIKEEALPKEERLSLKDYMASGMRILPYLIFKTSGSMCRFSPLLSTRFTPKIGRN